jgi:hypothetical protein
MMKVSEERGSARDLITPVHTGEGKPVMTIIGLFHWKPDLSHEKVLECLGRRLTYKEPEGADMLFEYWPSGLGDNTPAVVAGYEMSDFAPIMELELFWGEYFDITMLPAVSAEDGIKLGADAMQHIAAMA